METIDIEKIDDPNEIYIARVTLSDVRKGNIRLAIICAVILFFILTIFSLFIKIDQYNKTLKQKTSYITGSLKIQNDIRNNLNSNNDKFTEERLKKIFSKNDLYIYTYNLWKYELYINDTLIKNTKSLSIKSTDKILIKETQKESSLPTAMIENGRLTRGDKKDKLANHISISERTYIFNVKEEGLVTSYLVEKGDFKKGELITLVFSDQLTQRLNFHKKEITINFI